MNSFCSKECCKCVVEFPLYAFRMYACLHSRWPPRMAWISGTDTVYSRFNACGLSTMHVLLIVYRSHTSLMPGRRKVRQGSLNVYTVHCLWTVNRVSILDVNVGYGTLQQYWQCGMPPIPRAPLYTARTAPLKMIGLAAKKHSVTKLVQQGRRRDGLQ